MAESRIVVRRQLRFGVRCRCRSEDILMAGTDWLSSRVSAELAADRPDAAERLFTQRTRRFHRHERSLGVAGCSRATLYRY